ncbi:MULTISPECIES: DUF2934 domain-containing protein [Desulfococcus]|uniref:DUF2934 domain-containing protein n=1 Tax=Desulfococcus multivorans DSM 2059 TaxID=1121405 RepID=S7U5Z1_DESML|nr:DUF2934 domain-containing protein [Desulfococcus multivorans]AOY59127.1 conserved uncharacterized protein, DUF2934 [Desulfococcus multivorans]AQV01362.1 hypothetical protein B2D07_11750 [Desulfococcus multivorans]EPR44936.1 Protein of unknown function DUF2934 [Desulfococcus multivorans DSM 2059]SJZ83760.1 Protein of unknown function [Desulfococcus multivorans DSM 2059]
MTEKSENSGMEELQNASADTAASPSMSAEERLQKIALAAYYLAEQRGFSPGGELTDWLEAEKQFDASLASESQGD